MAVLQTDLILNDKGFTAGIAKAQTALQKMPNASNQATNSLMNLSRVAQDAPYGFIGIANNINPLLESFQRLKATTGTTGGALKALGKELTGPAGIGLAVGVVSSLLVVFGDKLFKTSRAADEAENSAKKLKDAVQGIFQNAAKEAAEVTSLVAVLKTETETRQRKLAALNELKKIQPEIFSGLKLEGNAVAGLDTAYQGYIANLKTVIAVKLKQAQLEQLITKQLQLQGVTLTQSEKGLLDAANAFSEKRLQEARQKGDATGAGIISNILGTREKRQQELNRIQSDIDALFKSLQELSSGIDLKIKEPKGSTVVKDKIVPLLGLGDSDQALFSTIDRIFQQVQDRVNFRLKNLFNKKKGFDITGGSVKEKGLIPDETIKATQEQLQFISQAVSSVLQPAFSGLFDTLEEGGNVIKSFFDGFIDGIKRMIEQLLATAAISGILSLIPGVGAALGFSGNSFGSIFKGMLGFRAAGGPVSGGLPYLVGENAPELFVPSTSGRIVPMNNLGGITGGAMQMVMVTVDGRISGRNLELVTTRQQRYRLGNG